MRRLIKKIALLLPTLRRLHSERNYFAFEATQLNEKIVKAEESNASLRIDLERSKSEAGELQQKISVLVKQIETVLPQRLHVIGYARSGTTILMDILNSSSDIFIFSELNLHVIRKFPNIFSAYGGDNFTDHFLERKTKELPLRYKGSVPPGQENINISSLTPDEYINAIGREYRYIGDKIATANRLMADVSDLDVLKEFLDQEERSGALFFFTLRRPSENLFSISRMFQDANLQDWGKSIAETMIVIVESFLKGNRSYLVFHEDIEPSLINEMACLLGVDLFISPGLVGVDHQSTKGQSISQEKPWVSVLDAAYSELYNLYQCDNTVIKCSKTDGLIKKISRTVEKLRTLVAQLSKEYDLL